VDQNQNRNRGGRLTKKNFYHQKLYSEAEVLDIPEETGVITIGYSNETFGKFGEYGLEPVTSRVYVIYNAMMDDFTKDTVMIEQPTFVNIDGQKAGTFVLAQKDKYEENAINWGVQMWLVYFGNKSWLISFNAPTTMFDSPKNVEILDNFIKSIKFLGLK
jgi:hypothetical protein